MLHFSNIMFTNLCLLIYLEKIQVIWWTHHFSHVDILRETRFRIKTWLVKNVHDVFEIIPHYAYLWKIHMIKILWFNTSMPNPNQNSNSWSKNIPWPLIYLPNANRWKSAIFILLNIAYVNYYLCANVEWKCSN